MTGSGARSRIAVTLLMVVAALMVVAGGRSASADSSGPWLYGPNFTYGPENCPAVTDTTDLRASNVQFSSFSVGGHSYPLEADVWAPSSAAALPVMILVHGGGFNSGCRSTLQQEASSIASSSHPYTVMSIDYRLATNPGDGTGPCPAGSSDPYCGWSMWSTTAPAGCASAVPGGTGSPGAMLADLKAAVDYVHSRFDYAGVSMASAVPAWNGKVVMVGASAGGYLVQLAAAMASGYSCYWTGDAPVAVAAWSGGEVSYQWNDPGNSLYGQNPVCETTGVLLGSVAQAECQSEDVNLTQCGAYGSAECNSQLQGSSVYQNYQQGQVASDIPVFFSNSVCEGRNYDPPVITDCQGGPYQGIDIQNQVDFGRLLTNLGVPTQDWSACKVPGSGHATAYVYNEACENSTLAGSDVLEQTLSFLAPFSGS